MTTQEAKRLLIIFHHSYSVDCGGFSPVISEWIETNVDTQLRRLLVLGLWNGDSLRLIAFRMYGTYYEWRRVKSEWLIMLNELTDWLNSQAERWKMAQSAGNA